jgi:predicted RNA binding protein YcfA (HicA-like mRNA interferase family)
MRVKTKKLLKVLSQHYGYAEVRKGKGSHSIWKNKEGHLLVIPMKDQIKQGTYLAILRQAKIDKKDFESYL